MSLDPGAVFAGYTVVRQLGAGGMGQVYVAMHPRLPRHDALKILPRELANDPSYQRRFIREADAASSLWHPHIVGVHDRGEWDGLLWISMDFVDGLDAAQLLERRYRGGFPLPEAIAVISAIADALDYAHSRDVLHRDVKPANILVTDGPGAHRRIMLADFGIARKLVDGLADNRSDDHLTAVNVAVGTPRYGAPEQLTGRPVDGRADQYGLAATAFHLITGAPPYGDLTGTPLISAQVAAPPPRVAELRPSAAYLDPVLSRALAKRPADRFASCTEFARALSASTERIAPTELAPRAAALPKTPQPRTPQQPTVTQAPKRARSRQIVVALVLAAAVIGGLAAVVIGLSRSDRATPPTSESRAAVAAPITTAVDSATMTEEAAATTATSTARKVLPDADEQGFISYGSGARCAGADTAAKILRTGDSAVVICAAADGSYYYRGTRLSDGASLELTSVVRDGAAWVATNDTDGTQYQVRSSGLQIVTSGGELLATEAAVEVWP